MIYRTYCINSRALKGEHRVVYRRLETKVLDRRQYSSREDRLQEGSTIRDDITLQNCISTTTSTMKIILGDSSYAQCKLYTFIPSHPLDEAVKSYHDTEPEERRQSDFSPTMPTR